MKGEILKGHLDMLVLSALQAGPAHGYAVIAEIRDRSGGAFDLPEGTVYPVLHRLEERGLLESHWTDPEAGRRRRVYALSKAGRGALAGQRAEWTAFARIVSAFVGEPVPCPH
jgi:transcriptional regulator